MGVKAGPSAPNQHVKGPGRVAACSLREYGFNLHTLVTTFDVGPKLKTGIEQNM